MIVEDPDGSAPAGAYVSVPLLGLVLRAIRRRSRRQDEPADDERDEDSGLAVGPIGPLAPQGGGVPSEHRLSERSESAPRRRRIDSACRSP